MMRDRRPMRAAAMGLGLVVTLGLTAPGAVAAPTANPRDFQRAAANCQKGTKALQSEDIPKAREHYEAALAIVASYPDGHMGLGHVLMRESRFDEALKEYERAREGFVELGEAIFDMQAKRYVETQRQITSLRDALRDRQNALAGSSSGVGTSRASPSAMERDIVGIEEEIRKLEAVEMPDKKAPSEPPGEIYFHIGNAQFRLNRLDDAIISWETCGIKSPKFAMVHNNLAVAYWKKDRIEDAKKSLAHAAQLGFPVNPQFKADLEKASSSPSPDPEQAKP